VADSAACRRQDWAQRLANGMAGSRVASPGLEASRPGSPPPSTFLPPRLWAETLPRAPAPVNWRQERLWRQFSFREKAASGQQK